MISKRNIAAMLFVAVILLAISGIQSALATEELIEPETPKNGKTVAINAGHQLKGNSKKEPIGPGSKETKAKVTSGTRGVATKVYEYQLNLDVSLKLRDELLARGYEVVMIRETNDVDISNVERAKMATEAGADILLHIHANGAENQKTNGILMVAPTQKNPYIKSMYKDCRNLANLILAEMLNMTKANSKGVWETDTMSGINWSTMPNVLIEMGFMTNPAEDRLMQTEAYQKKLVDGIAGGIDSYFFSE